LPWVYDQLKGATSTGEFGSILGMLFSTQSQAEFKEVRRETFHGHQTAIYNFRVNKMFCELAARHLDFYHRPVKTTRRKLTENFGQRPGKDTIAKPYSCPLK